MSIDVSVIIPTYNDWNRLACCVLALSKQTFPSNKFEVIIVNNNPMDTVPDHFRVPENFKIINEDKPGSYAARNAGIKISKGHILGFTDSDCIPDENWIKRAVEYLDNNETCSRIAGKINVFYSSSKPSVAEMYDNLYAFNQLGYTRNSGTAVTANMITYKSVFESIGYFNDNLMSGGDFDWGTRAHQQGFKIHYVREVVVNHPARQNLSLLIKKEKRVGGSQAIFLPKKNNNLGFNILDFVRGFTPHFGDFKFIFKRAKTLSFKNKLHIFLIKQYLRYIRSYERLRVSLGKKANRE